MAIGIYKCLYDFAAELEDDLTIYAGDVIKVTQQNSSEWLKGTTNKKSGIFPLGYAVRVLDRIPNRVGVVITNFRGQEEGDLTVNEGDVVGIIEDLDENWLQAFTESSQGILPRKFVKEIDFDDFIDDNYKIKDINENQTSIESIPWGEANDNFLAQEPDELTINKGDGIELLKEIDGFWMEGICKGQQGRFPKEFINVIHDLPPSLKRSDSNDKNEVDTVPKAKAIHMFVGENSKELSFDKGDIIVLVEHFNKDWMKGKIGNSVGLFPKNHVKILVDLPFEASKRSSKTDTLPNGEVVKRSKPTLPPPMQTSNKPISPPPPSSKQVSGPPSSANLSTLQAKDFKPVASTPPKPPAPRRKTVKKPPPPPVQVSTTSSNSPAGRNFHQPAKPAFPQPPKSPAAKPTIFRRNSKSSTKQAEPIHTFELTEEKVLMDPAFDYKPTVQPSPDIKPTLQPATDIYPRIHQRKSSIKKAKAPPIPYAKEPPRKPPEKKDESRKPPERRDDLFSSPPPRPNRTKLPKPLAPMPATPPLRNERLTVDNKEPSPLSNHSKVTSPVAMVDHELLSASFAKPNVKDRTYPETCSQPIFSIGDTTAISYRDSNISNNAVDNRRSLHSPELWTLDSPTNSIHFSSNAGIKAPERKGNTVDSNLLGGSTLPRVNKKKLYTSPLQEDWEVLDATDVTGFGENLHSFELKRIETQIAELKGKIEAEAYQLSGVETLLDFVSEEKFGDLNNKKEKLNDNISELNDELNALEAEKSSLLASFGRVDDVKNRVAELEKQIKMFLDNCEQLRRMQDVSMVEDLPEIRDNIEFCENMVDTLQDELNGLREKLGELDQADSTPDPEKEAKKKRQQQKVVEELIATEDKYINDLSLVMEVMKHFEAQENSLVNIKLLFGNLPTIVELSKKLFIQMTNINNEKNKPDPIPSRIAACFIELSSQMKECYANYCRNYDDAQLLLEKYEEDPTVWFQISKVVNTISPPNVIVNLQAYLIKPVQRVLKYPLLLSELLKNHMGEGPSRDILKSGLSTMTDVATAINESKRRKELVLKYRELEDGLGKRVQKLNWHSVAKKSSRINQRITQFTGLNSQTVDETFIELEKRFRALEKMIKAFLKNIVQFVEEFEENAKFMKQCSESIRQFYEDPEITEEVIKYYSRVYVITEQYASQMVLFMNRHVTDPLNQLLQLFQGPFRLIQKRNDKCLDYDRANSKAMKAKDSKDEDKIKQTQEELQICENVYRALNTQLLEELPTLCNNSSSFFNFCLSNFVETYKRYLSSSYYQLYELWQLSFVNKEGDMLETHQELINNATEQLTFLSFVPFSGGKDSTKRIQSLPAMLNRTSFFVDFDDSGNDPTSPLKPLIDANGNGYDEVDRASKDNCDSSEVQCSNDNAFIGDSDPFYIVKFNFQAEDDVELSATEGTIVKVKRKCDKKDNPEWWLVEYDGRKGYIPQSFLGIHKTKGRSKTTMDKNKHSQLKTSLSDFNVASNLKNSGDMSKTFSDSNLEPDPHTNDNGKIYCSDNDNKPTSAYSNSEKLSQTEQLNSHSPKKKVSYENVQYYYLEYNFEALNQGELSVPEGELVKVLTKHDQKGNSEWWLVEFEGKQGYVPGDFLVFVDEVPMC